MLTPPQYNVLINSKLDHITIFKFLKDSSSVDEETAKNILRYGKAFAESNDLDKVWGFIHIMAFALAHESAKTTGYTFRQEEKAEANIDNLYKEE